MAAVEKAETRGRIEALTGVRMLAAGAVFLSHTAVIDSVPGAARTFMAAGYNGVTLFFVLSGFVLAWNYSDRLTSLRPRPIWSFFVARFARVYPLYLVALLLVIAPLIATGQLDWSIGTHVLALQTWDPDVTRAFAFNRPGWSIGIEFFLYACFPLIIVVLRRSSRRLLLWVLGGAILLVFVVTLWFVVTGRGDLTAVNPQSAHRWLYRTPLSRLGDFTVGVIAALLIMRSKAAPAWAPRTAQVLGMVGFIGLMSFAPLLYSAWTWDAAYLIPTFLLLWGLAAGPQTRFARVLASRPMVLLGESSFAFYLLHTYVQDHFAVSGIDTIWGWILMVVVQFVVAVLLSIGAHFAIERPCQRWLRRRLDPRPKSNGPRLDVPVAQPNADAAPPQLDEKPATEAAVPTR